MDNTPTTLADPRGRLTVRRACLGAGICRVIAPELFQAVHGASPAGLQPGGHEAGAFTGVARHPGTEEELARARTAVAACPFGALHLARAAGADRPAGSPWQGWPRAVEPGVWMLGHNDPRNFGAMAWYLERPDGGVLIDLPRPAPALVEWIRARGGIRTIFLTHGDHVQGHAAWARLFPGAVRLLGAGDHRAKGNAWVDDTREVERLLPSDQGPLDLDGRPLPAADRARAEFVLLPQPGHSPGGFCLLYQGRYLFTGDHLSAAPTQDRLVAHRLQTWQDWSVLMASVEALRAGAEEGWLRFNRVLPGHGEVLRLGEEPDRDAVIRCLQATLDGMRAIPAGRTPLFLWILFVQARTRPRSFLGRLLRLLGGRLGEAWVLPRAIRPLLPAAPSTG